MSQNSPNIFDHHHGHDHDHDHDSPGNEQELDPAQQSMADALKVCFFLLQIAMIIVLVVYAFSGGFTVTAQEEAVALWCGQIVGNSDKDKVLGPGFHMAAPYPLGQVIKVDVTPQTLDISKDFWYELTDADKGKTIDQMAGSKSGPLNPERDGSVITGDFNIIHIQASLSYKVGRTVEYVQNVNDPKLAESLVQAAADQAIVKTIARFTADQVIKNDQSIVPEIVANIKRTLEDEMHTGLIIDPNRFAFTQASMPNPVRDAYQAVINAENERATAIETAQKDRNKTLQETAGDAYPYVLDLIREYERDLAIGDADKITRREKQIADVFTSLKITAKVNDENGKSVDRDFKIEGDVAKEINEANTYRSTIVAQVQTEAARFDSYYNDYKNNPGLRQILISRLWLETKEEVLGAPGVETIYLPRGQTYLELSRDPAVTRRRQEDQLKTEQQRRVEDSRKMAADAQKR